jgi:ribose 5-phosphate isomerase B
MRESVVGLLTRLGHQVVEEGGGETGIVDYPDVAAPVARKVSEGVVDRGILISRTGVGMCIVANKFPGIRAVNCYDDVMVETSRRHLDCNVLCLSGELVSESSALRMIRVWIETPFDEGRHTVRVQKIAEAEEETLRRSSRNIASWRHCDSAEDDPDDPDFSERHGLGVVSDRAG